MTYEELKERIMALQRECNDKASALKKQYAMEHNPVKVGDTFTDHFHTIKVERISVYGYPRLCMKYQGTELTKKGLPKKYQPIPDNPVYQCNLKFINGRPYKFEEDEQ